MSDLYAVLIIWSILGYFVGMFLPDTKSKTEAWLQLLFMGPIAWIVFIPVSIKALYNKAKQGDSDE